MTDNDIIKALECHLGKHPHRCMECPYSTPKCDCLKHLHLNSLDLINRQKAEIKKYENIIRLADKTIETQSAEIERLQEKLNHSIGVDNTKENGCFPFD